MPSNTDGRATNEPGFAGREDDRVRFAIVGDVEPKPEPDFENLAAAVDVVDRTEGLDFVAGIGDVAHNGTEVQYETATEILQRLRPPFYPILGNEELPGGSDDVERFLEYATRWNEGEPAIEDVSYSIVRGGVLFVFASAATDGKNFEEAELDWIEAEVNDHPDVPAVLFVHAAPRGSFPDGKTMQSANFDRVLARPSVGAVFSGHSHMDLDAATTEVRDEWGTHHVHVPGIERTKVGEEHVPRVRFVRIDREGHLEVRTYNLAGERFEERHGTTLSIS